MCKATKSAAKVRGTSWFVRNYIGLGEKPTSPNICSHMALLKPRKQDSLKEPTRDSRPHRRPAEPSGPSPRRRVLRGEDPADDGKLPWRRGFRRRIQRADERKRERERETCIYTHIYIYVYVYVYT